MKNIDNMYDSLANPYESEAAPGIPTNTPTDSRPSVPCTGNEVPKDLDDAFNLESGDMYERYQESLKNTPRPERTEEKFYFGRMCEYAKTKSVTLSELTEKEKRMFLAPPDTTL